jgi:hypothetical protein
VAAEGLDFRQCRLVVALEPPNSARCAAAPIPRDAGAGAGCLPVPWPRVQACRRSLLPRRQYVQSKGRARALGSSYVVMLQQGNSKQQVALLRVKVGLGSACLPACLPDPTPAASRLQAGGAREGHDAATGSWGRRPAAWLAPTPPAGLLHPARRCRPAPALAPLLTADGFGRRPTWPQCWPPPSSCLSTTGPSCQRSRRRRRGRKRRSSPSRSAASGCAPPPPAPRPCAGPALPLETRAPLQRAHDMCAPWASSAAGGEQQEAGVLGRPAIPPPNLPLKPNPTHHLLPCRSPPRAPA